MPFFKFLFFQLFQNNFYVFHDSWFTVVLGLPLPQQHQIRAASVTLTHWARLGIEPTCSRTLYLVLNPLTHNRNSHILIFNTWLEVAINTQRWMFGSWCERWPMNLINILAIFDLLDSDVDDKSTWLQLGCTPHTCKLCNARMPGLETLIKSLRSVTKTAMV